MYGDRDRCSVSIYLFVPLCRCVERVVAAVSAAAAPKLVEHAVSTTVVDRADRRVETGGVCVTFDMIYDVDIRCVCHCV